MKMQVCHIIFVAYFIQNLEYSKGKHVHIKIHVPQIIHKHNHKMIIYKKPHNAGGVKKHVVVHKHNHDHKVSHVPKHTHQHKQPKPHHKEKQPKPHHKEKHHKPFYKHYEYKHNPLPIQDNRLKNDEDPIKKIEDQKVVDLFKSLNDDILKSSIKTEHVEITQINPQAPNPEDRVNVRGSYRVQESDPYDTTTTSYHEYDSPFTKEIAKTLTNFKEYFQEPYEDVTKEDDKNYDNFQDYDDHLDYKNHEEQRLKRVILYKSHDEKSSSSD